MKNKKTLFITLAGFTLIYLSYISVIAVLSERIFYTLHLWAGFPDLQLLREQQAGDVFVCLLSVMFVYALWLLGCVKTYPALSAAPAFALCVLWLSLSIHPYSISLEGQAPFRLMVGGGALVFGFTGFSLIYGLYRFMRHKEHPRWNKGQAFCLCIWVLFMYVLDNMRSFITFPPVTQAPPTLLGKMALLASLSFCVLIYPMSVGFICAYPFMRRGAYRPKRGAALIILPLLYHFVSWFPFAVVSPRLGDAVKGVLAENWVVAGHITRAFPYMTAVLLLAGFQALRLPAAPEPLAEEETL